MTAPWIPLLLAAAAQAVEPTIEIGDTSFSEAEAGFSLLATAHTGGAFLQSTGVALGGFWLLAPALQLDVRAEVQRMVPGESSVRLRFMPQLGARRWIGPGYVAAFGELVVGEWRGPYPGLEIELGTALPTEGWGALHAGLGVHVGGVGWGRGGVAVGLDLGGIFQVRNP